MKTYRIGVAGLGNAGTAQVTAFQANPRMQVRHPRDARANIKGTAAVAPMPRQTGDRRRGSRRC